MAGAFKPSLIRKKSQNGCWFSQPQIIMRLFVLPLPQRGVTISESRFKGGSEQCRKTNKVTHWISKKGWCGDRDLPTQQTSVEARALFSGRTVPTKQVWLWGRKGGGPSTVSSWLVKPRVRESATSRARRTSHHSDDNCKYSFYLRCKRTGQ